MDMLMSSLNDVQFQSEYSRALPRLSPPLIRAMSIHGWLSPKANKISLPSPVLPTKVSLHSLGFPVERRNFKYRICKTISL